jgi:hypothetical protein
LVAVNKYPGQGLGRLNSVGGVKIQVLLPHGCQSLPQGAYLILKDEIRSAAFSDEDKIM